MNSFHEVITSRLRASAITGIVWGETGSPYYEDAPEPPPAFPYVVIEIPDTEVEHSFETPYTESFDLTVHVFGLRQDVIDKSSPYKNGTVFRFLDGMRQNPGLLNGNLYSCEQFTRKSWLVHKAPERDDGGGRVWVASAVYQVVLMVKD